MTNITQEEKINYIYEHIKSEKRNRIFKIIFKIILAIVIIFGFHYISSQLSTESMKETISKQIGDLATPIVQEMSDNIYGSDTATQADKRIKEMIEQNPEIINKFK